MDLKYNEDTVYIKIPYYHTKGELAKKLCVLAEAKKRYDPIEIWRDSSGSKKVTKVFEPKRAPCDSVFCEIWANEVFPEAGLEIYFPIPTNKKWIEDPTSFFSAEPPREGELYLTNDFTSITFTPVRVVKSVTDKWIIADTLPRSIYEYPSKRLYIPIESFKCRITPAVQEIPYLGQLNETFNFVEKASEKQVTTHFTVENFNVEEIITDEVRAINKKELEEFKTEVSPFSGDFFRLPSDYILALKQQEWFIEDNSEESEGKHPSFFGSVYDKTISTTSNFRIRNSETGRPIKCSNAVILADGRIVSSSSNTIVDPERVSLDLSSVLFGEMDKEEYREKYAGKFSKIKGSSYYLPVENPNLFYKTLSVGSLKKLFCKAYKELSFKEYEYFKPDNVCKSSFILDIPCNLEEECLKFKNAFSESVNKYASSYLKLSPKLREENTNVTVYSIPSTASFLQGVRIIDWESLFNRYCSFELNFSGYLQYSQREDVVSRSCFLKDVFNLNFGVEDSFCFHFSALTEYYPKESRRTLNSVGELLNYSTKVPFLKRPFTLGACENRNSFENIWLGVELEVEARRDRSLFIANAAATQLEKHAIMKYDGSLDSQRGVEITSVPATLQSHKENFKEFFEKHSKDFTTNSRTGLHVHVDRKAFTKLIMGKFTSFICKQENSAFICKIAGRPPCPYSQRNIIETLRGEVQKRKGVDTTSKYIYSRTGHLNYGCNTGDERYSYINFQNEHTIELRMFKSTASMTNFFKKLEFVDALVRFCREASMQQMTPYDFIVFIMQPENRKAYPCFVNWLGEKGYVKRKRIRVSCRHKHYFKYEEITTSPPINSVFHKETNNGLKHRSKRKSKF